MNNSRDHEKRPLQTVMLNSWGWSQRGEHKEENEDAFLNWPERYCWAVADGVGSSDYAARASQFLIKKPSRSDFSGKSCPKRSRLP